MERFFTFLLMVFLLSLTGCQSGFATNSKADDVEETTVKEMKQISDINKQDIKEITIRHTDSGDKQTFDQTRDMDILLDVLKNPGKMHTPDITSFADYLIQVHLTDNTSKRFDIWINEDYAKGMLMDISNPDVVYELSKAEVDKLRGIIKN